MYEAEWNDFMDRRVPVTVRFREDLWAVTVNEDPEFWLDAFEQREEAIRFCRDNNLPYSAEGVT